MCDNLRDRARRGLPSAHRRCNHPFQVEPLKQFVTLVILGPAPEWAMSAESMPHVLLVDDDLRLRALLETYLRREGFEVTLAGNGRQMDQALKETPVDLMVLDLMLPDRNGLEICRDLRAAGNPVPIVMLTAKGDDVDRILGLEIGADDYLPKPCNPRELAARIRAVLRRHHTQPPGAPATEGATVEFGQFRLKPGARVLEKDGAPVN